MKIILELKSQKNRTEVCRNCNLIKYFTLYEKNFSRKVSAGSMYQMVDIFLFNRYGGGSYEAKYGEISLATPQV